MAQKATVALFHEVSDEEQVIVISGFTVHDYISLAREINTPVCSPTVLKWLCQDTASIENNTINWHSKPKANVVGFDRIQASYCIKLEEVQ